MAPAGNRAVGRFVRSLQRTPDFTQTVHDVDATGITRLEVRGLKYGVDGFQERYGQDASDERNKTKESPSHMAVVLAPDKLDPISLSRSSCISTAGAFAAATRLPVT